MAGKSKLIRSALRILGGLVAGIVVVWIVVAQPVIFGNRPSAASVDPAKLRRHVEKLSLQFSPRDWRHTENLDKCASYIEEHFRKAGAAVQSQTFTESGKQYRNVIGRFGGGKGSKVVVGAHYDACGPTPGADDNASGIAALLELANLIGQSPLNREVELVAYVLEEPPFFRGPSMGSAIHAKSIAAETPPIKGVIVLEMVGTFRDEWFSQSYTIPLLYLLYPSRGNFIAVVGPWAQGAWIKKVKAGMTGTSDLPVRSIRAPEFVPGVDYSDHLNYWPYGINALMVTDTAFLRCGRKKSFRGKRHRWIQASYASKTARFLHFCARTFSETHPTMSPMTRLISSTTSAWEKSWWLSLNP